MSTTELVHGSHTQGMYVHSSSRLVLRRSCCPGGPLGDELVVPRGVRTPCHIVDTGRWTVARGAPCEYAADESRGTTCHTRCTCAASPGASVTRAACTRPQPRHSQYISLCTYSTYKCHIQGVSKKVVPQNFLEYFHFA